MRPILFGFLLLPSVLYAQTDSKVSGRATMAKLVGIWQDMDVMAAGWRNAYCFFGNGKVVWHSNQMDLDKRLYDRSGTWAIANGRLVLKFTEESVVVGGKWIKDYGGDGESNIKGGKLVHRRLKASVSQSLRLGSISRRGNYPSMMIGSDRFWKFESDPKQYN